MGLILVKYRLKSMLVRLFYLVFWFSGAVQARFAACRLSLQKNSPLRDIGVEPVPVLTRSWYVTRQIGALQDPRLRPRPSSYSADFSNRERSAPIAACATSRSLAIGARSAASSRS